MRRVAQARLCWDAGLLFCGLAFKLADERLDDGDFGRAEDARGRQRRTGLTALLDERGGRQAFERIAVADEAVFEVQAPRFQRAEEPFDDQRQRWRSMIRVASASEVAACVVNRRPDDRTFARRRIDLVASTRLSDSCGGSRTQARPRPLWQRPNRRETLAATILTRYSPPRDFLTAAPTTRIGHFTPQLFIMYRSPRAAKSTKSERRGRSRDVERGGDEGVAAKQLREPICELPRAH